MPRSCPSTHNRLQWYFQHAWKWQTNVWLPPSSITNHGRGLLLSWMSATVIIFLFLPVLEASTDKLRNVCTGKRVGTSRHLSSCSVCSKGDRDRYLTCMPAVQCWVDHTQLASNFLSEKESIKEFPRWYPLDSFEWVFTTEIVCKKTNWLSLWASLTKMQHVFL